MRILFLHDNFPAQFGYFGHYLANKGWDVLYGTQRRDVSAPGIKVFNYAPHRTVTQGVHPYVARFESAALTGQAVARQCVKLSQQGLSPEIVVAHSGWGPGMYIKDIWPDTKYIGYFEWFYQIDAPDLAFLDKSPRDLDTQLRSRARNTPIIMDLAACDTGICPTHYQRSQFPEGVREKLNVVHDGIDTNYFSPSAICKSPFLKKHIADADEIITYVARGLEPYRGFLEFIKAMEIVLAKRSLAHVIVVGEDRVAYGKKLPDGMSYKRKVVAECDLDWNRVHFLGLLPRDQYRAVLSASTVHAYLTIPFVLSWSILEAMSMGCCVVASDVEPVREVSGREADVLALTSLAPEQVADRIISLLESPKNRAVLSKNARDLIVRDYAAEKLFPLKEQFLKAYIEGTFTHAQNSDKFFF